MDLTELLGLRGLDLTKRIKLVRHQDSRLDLGEVHRAGFLELYQAYQSRPVFSGCDVVVSFLGLEDSRAKLFGVYRVLGARRSRDVPLPAKCPYPDLYLPDGHFYELCEVSGFEDLKDRLVIDWGRNPLAWHQWLTNKSVVEILPSGRVAPFPGHLEFVLRYEDLRQVVNEPRANRDWHLSLGSVAGVYLITDSTDGRQYVGSATGKEGVLGRWRAYAKSGHGGNALLQELLKRKGPGHARHLRFTILATLPRGLSRMEALQHEALYKRKLGSRAFGLNT